MNPRVLAPDLARGLMLLLIVLSNTVFHLWAAPLGPAGWHPVDGSTLDRVVQFLMIVTLDLRVFPLFAFLFGYGLWQSYRRRVDAGTSERDAAARVRRRCAWLIVFGALHAALLMAGDILGAYGVLGLLVGGLLLRRADRTLRTVVFVLLGLLLLLLLTGALMQGAHLLGGPPPADPAPRPTSVALYGADEASWLAAAATRVATWAVVTPSLAFSLTAPLAMLLGVLAARRRILEEPGRHRGLLAGVAVVGIAGGWLGGLPAALAHLGTWPVPAAVAVEGGPLFVLQLVSGPAAGLGYVAVFALLADRLAGRRYGPVVTSVRAMGKRSMSTYLAHSVLFAPLLAAWGLGLGAHLSSASMAVLAVGVWLVTAVAALALERAGRAGPAEALLRRLVDGPRRPAPVTAAGS